MAQPHILTARDIMTRRMVTLSPETKMHEAAQVLMKKHVGGAPVVDDAGRLLGLLSELDCLRCFLSDSFNRDDRYFTAAVADFMTREVVVIEPGLDVYGIVQAFLEHPVRRLPVVEGDSLMGLVTRRDLMLGVAAMRKERAPHSRYPDYPPDRIPLQSHYREHWSEERPSHSRLRRFRPR